MISVYGLGSFLCDWPQRVNLCAEITCCRTKL